MSSKMQQVADFATIPPNEALRGRLKWIRTIDLMFSRNNMRFSQKNWPVLRGSHTETRLQ
jgi:hypothetical protein